MAIISKQLCRCQRLDQSVSPIRIYLYAIFMRLAHTATVSGGWSTYWEAWQQAGQPAQRPALQASSPSGSGADHDLPAARLVTQDRAIPLNRPAVAG